jgi:cytoskeletal protein RodZ
MDYQQKQALFQKLKIAAVGVVGGGIAWWIVLASVFGWMSPTTAQQQTSDAVQAKVDQVLAPLCAERFMADKTAMAKFLKTANSYDRDELVQNTVPKIGSTKVDYQLSDNCASTVKADVKNAAKKPAPSAPKKS